MPLSREEFYVECVFKEMEGMRSEERGRHMHDVYLHLEQLCARTPSFRATVASVRFVQARPRHLGPA